MMNLSALLLLCLAVTFIAADGEVPDCEACEYVDNIGLIKSEIFCAVYYVCTKKPYKKGEYHHDLMCCPEGQSFDPELLTCSWHKEDDSCDPDRSLCPPVTTTLYPVIFECLYEPFLDEGGVTIEKKYKSKYTNEEFECSFGTVWDQPLCVCIFGAEFHLVDPKCSKIINFDFETNLESYTECHIRTYAIPAGDPTVANGVLCLMGDGSFVTVPYLSNWFTFNPIANSFTLCFWFRAAVEEYDLGLFSSDCDSYGAPLLEIILEDSKLKVFVAGALVESVEFPSIDKFHSVCVVYDYGSYIVFYDGQEIGSDFSLFDYPPIGHQPPTLGYVPGYKPFHGYFDDFCLWSEADVDLADNFHRAQPSNDNSYSEGGPAPDAGNEEPDAGSQP